MTLSIQHARHSDTIPKGAHDLVLGLLRRAEQPLDLPWRLIIGRYHRGTATMPSLKVVRSENGKVMLRIKPGDNSTARDAWLVPPKGIRAESVAADLIAALTRSIPPRPEGDDDTPPPPPTDAPPGSAFVNLAHDSTRLKIIAGTILERFGMRRVDRVRAGEVFAAADIRGNERAIGRALHVTRAAGVIDYDNDPMTASNRILRFWLTEEGRQLAESAGFAHKPEPEPEPETTDVTSHSAIEREVVTEKRGALRRFANWLTGAVDDDDPALEVIHARLRQIEAQIGTHQEQIDRLRERADKLRAAAVVIKEEIR